MERQKMETIKVFEMFSGYGGASWGLKKANIEFEVVGISEINKYAIQCYNQNFPNVKNYGDCSKIDTEELPDFDLLTGGFPCQDVSIAGKRDLSKGRTNLYKEVLRIANAKKPKYILLENVKGLESMEVDERSLVNIIVNDLKKIGYDVIYKVLNTKDYGIPQNRERIWFVCKLGQWDFMEFQFPNPIPLKIFLKDILEKDIDKKYYLSERMIKGIMKSKFMERKPIDINNPYRTLKVGGDTPCIFALRGRENGTNAEFNLENTSNCLTSSTKENLLCMSLYPRSGNPKQGGTGLLTKNDGTSYCIDTGNMQAIQIGDFRYDEGFRFNKEGNSPCLNMGLDHHSPSSILYVKNQNNLRRLTPKECFRLMGFLNDEIDISNISDTQLYRLAGNGWDVNLVSKIFKNMIK